MIFFETLNLLIPCSLLVSLMQILLTKNKIKYNNFFFKKNFFIYCLSVIFISIIFLSKFVEEVNFNKIIGITLILILFTKLITKLKMNFQFFMNKNQKIVNLLIGLIHGTTNMGGSFLSIYINEITKEKIELKRYLIGFTYFFMALTQLISLLLTRNLHLTKVTLFCVLLTFFSVILTFKLIKKIQVNEYNYIFNLILLVYALLLLLVK